MANVTLSSLAVQNSVPTGASVIISQLASDGSQTFGRVASGVLGGSSVTVGTTAGTVAAGNDSRIVNALQPGALTGYATTLQLNAAIAGITPGTSYTLPTATTSLLGGVKVDGSTITIANGVISTVSGAGGTAYTLPQATTSILGGVKPDGTTITVNAGVISAVGATSTPVGAHTITAGASYAMATADRRVWVRLGAAAALALTLPSAPTANVDYIIKDTGGTVSTGTPCTVTPASGLIDGKASFVMTSPYQSLTLEQNGTDWSVV